MSLSLLLSHYLIHCSWTLSLWEGRSRRLWTWTNGLRSFLWRWLLHWRGCLRNTLSTGSSWLSAYCTCLRGSSIGVVKHLKTFMTWFDLFHLRSNFPLKTYANTFSSVYLGRLKMSRPCFWWPHLKCFRVSNLRSLRIRRQQLLELLSLSWCFSGFATFCILSSSGSFSCIPLVSLYLCILLNELFNWLVPSSYSNH